ncbi:unnamed protein product [Effrenium voratum]|nr:unnamed protein product [Effrenium voratum]
MAAEASVPTQLKVDASSQTDERSLVSQYPANLLFAQGMLNTTLLQLQQVELQISRLHGYVREHRLLESKAMAKGRVVFNGEAEALYAAAAALSAYAEAPRGDAPAPAGDAAAGQEVQNQNRAMHRRFIGVLFKAGLILVLINANMAWYVILLAIGLLYMGRGLKCIPSPDRDTTSLGWAIRIPPAAAAPAPAPAPDRAPGHAREGAAPAQPQDQHQLLRRRFANVAKVALIMFFFIDSKFEKLGRWFLFFILAILYLCGMFNSWIDWLQNFGNAQVTLEQQLNAMRQERAAEAPAAPAAAPEAAEGAAADASTGGEGEVPADAQRPPAENPEQPPYWQRFVYQLLVMFFLTLIPWWNPNPRYL